MTGCFSDKSWSGTPMWQIAEELEAKRAQRDAEERRKASTPIAVLNIRVEGLHHVSELMLFIPSLAAADVKPDPASGGFREVKVRGPRRRLRAEAVKDGFELRLAFYRSGEAEVRKRQRELRSTTWAREELPGEGVAIEEEKDREQRLRLAQRPSGTGWSRQKDAEFFVHTQAPMAYDPKKVQYFTVDATTQQYVPCAPPHDPTEYPIIVNAGASLVGRSDEDLSAPERPRTLLLTGLVKTGAAMKKPLFFLDQPASCFAMFEGLRGSSAVDYCSKNFHTKLLQKLSSSLQFWSDEMVENLLKTIFEELDAELLQQPNACYDGVSAGVALLLGDRVTVASLGTVRALLVPPTGEVRVVGEQHHVMEEGPERQRVDTASGEVVQDEPTSTWLLRRPVHSRELSAQDQAAEIERVRGSPDSFATLGFAADDAIDSKAAKASYRKLALKVHPDKATPELTVKAKEAFAKVEAAVERVETLCEADPEATVALHKILSSAGPVTSALMPRSWACKVLGVEDGVSLEDAEHAVSEAKKTLGKLGQFADGRFGHPDTARAAQLLDEALEVLAAPAPKEGLALGTVAVTRALGLRDLKRPRPIVSGVPGIQVAQLDRIGGHHLCLLSSTTAGLGDEAIVAQLRKFPRQPKAASLTIAQDAAKLQGAKEGSPALASSVVGVFEVGEEKAEEPPAKKARKEKEEKVRCLHILLKHKDLKMAKDMDSQHRLKGKGPVTRTVAQAERELLEFQRALAANPNNFHVLARKHSECDTGMQPGQNAGDLGWMTRGNAYTPQFEQAMFALGLYEVSDIVSTPRGLHIIQRIG